MTQIAWLNAPWIDFEVHRHDEREWIAIKWFNESRDKTYIQTHRFDHDEEAEMALTRISPEEAREPVLGLVVRYNPQGLPRTLRVPGMKNKTAWRHGDNLPPSVEAIGTVIGTTYANQCKYFEKDSEPVAVPVPVPVRLSPVESMRQELLRLLGA